MSKTPVLAAVSAALLALSALSDGLVGGVTQKIKDEQYSRFISGASFCTGAFGFTVWTNANETWTASGGLDPRYWSGTSGAVVTNTYDEAPDGSYYYYSRDRWGQLHQPPVYGKVDEDAQFSSLYHYLATHAAGSKSRLVDIDTSTAAPVVCRFAEKGDVVAADGSDIFFDANVTLEAFAYGEANRPDDSVLAPDAKLAIYMQDTTSTGDPGLFIVARDWNTGAVQHYRVWGGGGYGLRQHSSYSDPHRYSGRIVVRAVRSVHKGKYDPVVSAFLVYLTDGREPCYWHSYGSGNPPVAGPIQWDKVRDDLGDYIPRYSSNPLFQPLSLPYGGMRLSKVSYGGGVRLGAYAVGTADPMRTTVRWAADSGMVRQFSIDSQYIDEAAFWGEGYPGAEAIDAKELAYYRSLELYDWRDAYAYVSWQGTGGWSDGDLPRAAVPGGGCEYTLGPDLFPKGRASLSTMPDDDEGLAAEWEEGLPPRVGERIGNRYVEVSDALAHAAVLGGTVRLLASPDDSLVVTQLEADVAVNMTAHAVPSWDDGDRGARGDVAVSARPGSTYRFTLREDDDDGNDGDSNYAGVYGGLYVTNAAFYARSIGFYVPAQSCLFGSPGVTLSDVSLYGSLFSAGSTVSLDACSIGNWELWDDNTNVVLVADGGGLRVSGSDLRGNVIVSGARPVSMSGSVAHWDVPSQSTVRSFVTGRTDIRGSTNVTLSATYHSGPLVVSNSVGVVVDAVQASGGLWLVDVLDAVVTGAVKVVGGLHVYRSAVRAEPGASIDALELDDSAWPLYSGTLGWLTLRSSSGVGMGGSLQVTGPTTVYAPIISVGGGTFAATTFDRCGTVSVSNSTMAATTFDRCESIDLAPLTSMQSLALRDCGAVTLPKLVLHDRGWGYYPDGSFSVYGCDVVAESVAGGRLSVIDGSLMASNIEAHVAVNYNYTGTATISNSAVTVYGGRLGYMYDLAYWSDTYGGWVSFSPSAGNVRGDCHVVDSTLTLYGGQFSGIRAYGNTHITVTGGEFFQDVETYGTPDTTISGGRFGVREDGYRDVGGSLILSNTVSIAISGDARFSKDVRLTAPTVTISGGTFSRSVAFVGAVDVTISGGTFPSAITVSPSVSDGGRTVLVSGGEFVRDVSQEDWVRLPPGKKMVRKGDNPVYSDYYRWVVRDE